jgi:transposase
VADLEAKAEAAGMTVVWVDETGLRLLPALVRTWAPCGQTPILRTPLSREHLSVIGALTPTGRLFTRTYEHALKGPQVVRFLKHLLAHLPGRLLVLWDGASIHRGHVVQDFLKTAAGQRLHLVALPGYAPDLNPAEGVWRLLKRGELKNLFCEALWELRIELRQALARLRHRVSALQGCIHHAGYLL